MDRDRELEALGSGPSACPAELDARHRLLTRLAHDAMAGGVLALEAYEALFPGLGAIVAEEYNALVREAGQSTPDPLRRECGGYHLESLLGGGAQSTVYVAVHPSTGERVALKIVRPDVALVRSHRLRFEGEAKVLRNLRHPGVVRVREVGIEDGLPWIASDLVVGETLSIWIERRAALLKESGVWPSATEALHIIEQLARAVQAVHEAGILHRDIKPANVIMDPSGQPVLVDFGLARDTLGGDETLTGSDDVLGTLAYLPPERLRGDAHRWDRRSDVYCLGATLYQALTLRPPFPRRAWLDPLGVAPPDPRLVRKDLSRDVAAVVAAALAPEPADRYASAGDLADDLVLLAKGVRPGIRGRSILGRMADAFRRDPWVTSLLVLPLVLLGVCAFMGRSWLGVERSRLAESEHRAQEQRMVFLLEQSGALWPELPSGVPAMDEWIVEAEDVMAGSALVAGPGLARGNAPLLVTGASALETALASVRARRARALGWAARSVEEHAAAWETAALAVLSDGRFGGFALQPQAGLVPLGLDPATGLQEFAHLPSGHLPTRDALTDELVLMEGFCVVLVLLPAGTVEMDDGEDLPETDRGESGGQAGARAVALEPFLISKYELTQGQWLHLCGENPSRWSAGSSTGESVHTGHPLENVTWRRAVDVLGRVGLTLPTEAQWEYAARAGTRTPWWTGEDRESLRGMVNIADNSSQHWGPVRPEAADWPDFFDGFFHHAPAGSFPANGFGLHEVAGNVWEWCRDPGLPYTSPVREGDGLRLGQSEVRIVRGGGYCDPAASVGSAHRDWADPETRTFSRGVRPTMEWVR